MFFRSLIFVIVCFMIPSYCLADEPVVFGSFPIPAMVVDSDHGVFIELTREMAKRADLEIDIVISPPRRAFNRFSEKKVDVIFPALDVNFPAGMTPVKSKEIIYVKTDYVFTKKGSPFLITIQDLTEKKVGITLGYPYANELIQNNLITLDTAPDDNLNVKKLIAGRFDAFVVEEKSGLKAFRDNHLEDRIQYDPHVPLSRQDVYYAFQTTDKGRELARKLSDVLAQMKADGSFQAIIASGD